MMDLLQFAFQSGWHFFGCLIILVSVLRFPIALVRAISDWQNTNKYGWKPKNSTLTDEQLKEILKDEN